ncbi:MAG UNVERIFIED_CONTAM: hypothetical protein LVR18_21335 [Planctomycetaceae bacterium]
MPSPIGSSKKNRRAPKPSVCTPKRACRSTPWRGPFGPYLQLGEVTAENPKPKRCSIPNCFAGEQLDLPTAIELLSLPRRLGKHPLTDKVVNAGIGKFGPYVTHDKVFASFDRKSHTWENDGQVWNVLTIPLDAAVEMLRTVRKKAAPVPLRELGPHPEDQAPVQIFEGRYGPYVKHGDINATIPKDTDIGTVTLQAALAGCRKKQPAAAVDAPQNVAQRERHLHRPARKPPRLSKRPPVHRLKRLEKRRPNNGALLRCGRRSGRTWAYRGGRHRMRARRSAVQPLPRGRMRIRN